MTWIQPLEIQKIFVNMLSGNIEIFAFMAFISISVLAAKFQMPNSITLVMFVLFAVIMNTYLNLGGIYILLILLTGLITFYSLSKLWE